MIGLHLLSMDTGEAGTVKIPTNSWICEKATLEFEIFFGRGFDVSNPYGGL